MHTQSPMNPASPRPIGPVQIASAAELMKNYVDASLVAVEHGFAVAQDRAGEPLIFAVDGRQRLIAIHRDPGGPTGFASVDLSGGLGAELEVAAFAASQAQGGAITLALALRRPGERACQLFLSPPLANEGDAAAWTAAARAWVVRPAALVHDVTAILMGTSDDGLGAPMTVVATRGAREATHFRVNADLHDPSWVWSELLLPENADEIYDLALGTVQGDRGVFALYRIGGQQTLTFTSLPDPEYGKISRYDFKAPARLRCIAALPRPGDGEADLFAAGDGAFLFAGAGADAQAIADAPLGITRILARGDREAIGLWMLCGERLIVGGGRRGELARWATPTAIAGGVRQIDALRNQARLTHALFLARADGRLEYQWRDPEDGTWSAAPIGLPASAEVIEFNAYTTQITFTDDHGALAGLELEVRASAWVSLTLNGAVQVVDGARPVRARTDAQGRLTIMDRASSLDAPTLTIRAPSLGLERRIDPTDKVMRSLAELQSGDALKERGLGVDRSAATRDAAAAAIGELLAIRGELTRGDGVDHGPLAFAALDEDAAGESWGLSFAGDEAVFLTGDAAVVALRGGDGPEALAFDGSESAGPLAFFVDAGAFLRGLLDGVLEVAGFFLRKLQEGWALVVKIGDDLFQLAIKAASELYQAIHWVLLKTLNIDLDKIVEAIGFIFAWRDIVVTHDVLINLVTETLARGEAELGRIEGVIDGFFTDLKARIRGQRPLALAGVAADAPARGVSEGFQQKAPGEERVDDFLASPAGGFASYHLGSGRARGGDGAGAADAGPLAAFMADLGEIWATIESTLRTLGKDVADGILGGRLSVNQLIEMIASDAALGLLEVARVVAIKVVALGRRLAGLARELLTAPIELPVITGLYRTYVGGQLTAIGAVALLVAAPITVIYKILRGEAPFPFVDADAPLAFASDDAGAEAVDPKELSTHPRHQGAAQRPRTRGFDTLKGAGIWAAIMVGGAVVGGAGYVLLRLLSSVDRINQMIIRPLYSGVERIKEFATPLVAPALVITKSLVWVGKAIWLTINAAKGGPVGETALSFARWGVSGFAVVAEIIGAVDPVEKVAPILRALTAVVDLLLAIPYGILRIVAHAGTDDADLIPLDITEMVVATADCAGTLCSSASKMDLEPTSKAILWGISMVETVWSLGMTVVINVTPILMDRPVEPIA